jgi:hypothetical protein
MTRPSRLLVQVPAVLAAISCGSPEQAAPPLQGGAGTDTALVSSGSPYVEPSVSSLPPLGLHGKTFDAPPSLNAPFLIHEGVFSDGVDLGAPPTSGQAAWVGTATGTAHASAPDFGTVLGQALGHATGVELPKLDTSVLDTLTDFLGLLDVSTTTSGPDTRFLGFTPERARWLASRTFFVNLSQLTVPYADPLHMANLRQRGARLYCAAREAQNAHQSGATKSMGKQVAFSVDLFGEQVDFLAFEPTFALDGPLPYLGGPPGCPVDPAGDCGNNPAPHDGAQAFMVPLLLGTQLTPLSLLPSLPEIRYPVVLVTGDTELVTPVGGIPPLVIKNYRTVTHADSILSAWGGAAAGKRLVLARVGPAEVTLNLGAAVGVGLFFAGSAAGQCPHDPLVDGLPGLPGTGAPANDRLLSALPSGPPAPGWPSPRSGAISSFGGIRFGEGPWLPSALSDDTLASFTFSHLSSDPSDLTYVIPLASFDPLTVRALEDDDRHLWTSSTAQLCGLLSLGFGGALGPLHASLSGGGSLSAFATMRHDLRWGLVAIPLDVIFNVPPAVAMEALAVAPRVTASADLELFVHLTLEIEVDLSFIGTVTITLFNDDLLNTGPINLASYDSGPWAEEHRFRLGTGSSFGDPMKQPVTLSHLPNGPYFGSFPAGKGVDACLADPAPNVPAPTPCLSQPAAQDPPQVEICAWMGGGGFGTVGSPPLPPNVCGQITAFVDSVLPSGTPAQKGCLRRRLVFLCLPVTKQQPFANQSALARVLDLQDPLVASELQAVIQTCVNANLPDGATQADAQAYAQSIYHYALCKADATLLDDASAVTPVGSPFQPPPVTSGQCL